jgi:hypothetical protein
LLPYQATVPASTPGVSGAERDVSIVSAKERHRSPVQVACVRAGISLVSRPGVPGDGRYQAMAAPDRGLMMCCGNRSGVNVP